MTRTVAEGSHGAIESARRSGLLVPGEPVVVMVSGGPDSVCLLDVAAKIVGPDRVVALHVDHGLRPTEADLEVCSALCERLGVGLEVARLDPDSGSGNLQAWARESRYRLGLDLAEANRASLAVGHTASDQAETILYRLAAAPGRRALLGMKPKVGRIVRPLLGVERSITVDYCRSHGLPTVNDPSNETDRFARNRVRRRLVAALREIHPAAEANVIATAEILRDEAEVLDSLVDGLVDGEAPDRSIPLARLREQPAALRRLTVQRLADDAVGRLAPGVARRADEIAAMPLEGKSMLDLPSGVRAVAERGVLRFVPQVGRGG
ncbi:MAG: tRNA lysidine(34) synthetase TilS [Actinomycetes bacterium]